MKKLSVLFIAITLTLSALAGVEVAPQINFSGSLVSALEVCYIPSSDMLRTSKKVSKYEWVNDEYVQVGKGFLTTPRVFLKAYPNGDGTEMIQQSYPLTVEVSYSENEEFYNPSSSYEYTIPNCK